MEKKILVVDDVCDKVVLEELRDTLRDAVNIDSHISYSVDVDCFNPRDFLQEQEPIDRVLKELDRKVNGRRLDMFLCDFNISQEHKLIAFHMIEHLRKSNISCTVLLYSGNPLRELLRLEYDGLAQEIISHIKNDNPKLDPSLLEEMLNKFIRLATKHEQMFNIATTVNISEFVSRDRLRDKAAEYITKPSLPLRIEEQLLAHEGLEFSTGNALLDGALLGALAQEIRSGSPKGEELLKEILELSIAHMIALHV